MADSMNVFRIFGDLSHMASKIILITAIHRNSSAEGVSLLTQLLYGLVFVTRYVDLLWTVPWRAAWNFVFKITYLSTSAYVVYIMMRVFPRTREKEGAWKLATWCLGACLIATPIAAPLLEGWSTLGMPIELLWIFSIILESVCILPQLLLLRQTSVPTVLDSFYLVALGSYRTFYLINWIYKAALGHRVDWVSMIFGTLQTLLYVDFAWVYYSRQRVKLRGGGVVDSDDLGKSFLVRRFIGNQRVSQDEDVADEDAALAGQENGTIRSGAGTRQWGVRGISVSADDTLDQHQTHGPSEIASPDAFADDYDEDADAPPPPAKDHEHRRVGSDASVKADESTTEWASSVRKSQDED
ncbi:hypothetical protein LTR95_018199 [Oleoguttula sp. CCFEE 5521]